MMWPQLQSLAQIAISRILNSLPEGLLIALFAWAMLRLLPRQNSGTRFAVWFIALLAVAGLPLIGGISGEHSFLAVRSLHPLITLPGHWGPLLFLAWVVAAFAAMLRLAVGLWRLRELRSNCVPIDAPDLDGAVRKTIAGFRSSRSVTLATSERVSVPAAIGFFKPMIVLPAWALGELPPDELKIILLHELAHLRRWDDWTNLLQKIVRAVFPFHPAVFWIERRLSLEREMACDDQVLAETANPHSYAKCLIALLERSFARRKWAMVQAAVHRAREASLRLARILDATRPETRHIWKPALGLVGAFSLVCLLLAPRAPQWVAVGHKAPAMQTADVRVAALNQPRSRSVAVIPAALHTSPAPSVKKRPRPAVQVAGHYLVEDRRDRVMAARWSANDEHSLADAAASATKQSVSVPAETLLIIRTTERIGPDSWVWSVGVWKVTWVNSSQDRAEKGLVAKTT